MSYGDFKDLGGGAASNKLLRDEVFNIAKNPKYDEYQRGFASVFYKKTSGSGVKISNEQLLTRTNY